MSVFPVSPLATTPSETTLYDGIAGDAHQALAAGTADLPADLATTRHHSAAYLALSPGTHIFEARRGLRPPSFSSTTNSSWLGASASSLPQGEGASEVLADVVERACRLVDPQQSARPRESIAAPPSDNLVSSSDRSLDGWQLERQLPDEVDTSFAYFCRELLPPGQKNHAAGRRLIRALGLTPLFKDLSCVVTARGDTFLMTPSVVGDGETAGAFGKFRLALDCYGMLLAVKQVRTAEAQLHKLARHGFDLRGRGALQQSITSPSAFCFEMAVAQTAGRDFFHAGLTRLDGKLLSFHTLYAGGSITRLFDAPLRFRDHLALRIIEDVAGDLARLNTYGVVHRDVRPPNIMWDDGGFYLQDFGSARPLGSDGLLADTTATFLPPENCGPNRYVCAQTDAWSLGMSVMSLLPSAVKTPLPLAFFVGPHSRYDADIEEYERWRQLYLAQPQRALSSPTPGMTPITRQCHAFFAERSLIAPRAVDVALRHLLAARPEERAQSFSPVVAAAQQARREQDRLEVLTQLWLTDKLQRGPMDALGLWKRRLLAVRELWLEQVVHQSHDRAADA